MPCGRPARVVVAKRDGRRVLRIIVLLWNGDLRCLTTTNVKLRLGFPLGLGLHLAFCKRVRNCPMMRRRLWRASGRPEEEWRMEKPRGPREKAADPFRHGKWNE